MELKDSIKFGVIVLLLTVFALIFASGVTFFGDNSFSYTVRHTTNLTDTNENDVFISCNQSGSRFFNITNSLDTLGDANISDYCQYNYTNVTMAVYYDGIFKDNFTLNCTSDGSFVDSFPLFQVNVSNGLHNVTYTTNLCYENVGTNDTVALGIPHGFCIPFMDEGSQCVTYTNSTSKVYPQNNYGITLMIFLMAVIVIAFVIFYIAGKF